jgi:hypothetical protein
VVTNPHIQRVYMGYFHAFETLRVYRPVKSLSDNNDFCALLRRLVDEHGEAVRAEERHSQLLVTSDGTSRFWLHALSPDSNALLQHTPPLVTGCLLAPLVCRSPAA